MTETPTCERKHYRKAIAARMTLGRLLGKHPRFGDPRVRWCPVGHGYHVNHPLHEEKTA